MVDWARAAGHYVLYRLEIQGYESSAVAHPPASILACNEDGTRVALIAVKCRQAPGGFRVSAAEGRQTARNLFFVFVDFERGPAPPCFVVTSAAVRAELQQRLSWPDEAWTANWLEPHEEAWRALALHRPPLAHAS
jgi:hypothetical protein